jgi:putative transposase
MSDLNTSQQGIRNSKMFLGEVYFWTATVVSWKRLFAQDKYKQVIIDSLKYLVDKQKIVVYGFVIMPNHVHILWEIKEKNGKEMPNASFLKFTAHKFLKDLEANHPKVLEVFAVEKDGRDHQFWQRDPLAIEMFSKQVFEQKLDYIHLNPLHERWNLADRSENYYWSSAKFYELGIGDFGFLTHYMDRY